jgi:5-formyltetrahydrofolate cyclo-ligase
MIFDSLGIGEIGVIIVVAILFIDPKKVGAAGRAFARFRKKWNNIQREVKQQFDTISLEEDLKDNLGNIRAAKSVLRNEARVAVKALTSLHRVQAAEKILGRLKEWPVFQEAKAVAAFCGTLEEVDTESIAKYILASGKTLLLPRIVSQPDGTSRIAMAVVSNYDQDLLEGAFGILEPKQNSDDTIIPEPDLILVPGLAFDERGGRVGRGKGFYDRYLDGKTAFKLGVGFEAQVLRKKLALEPHDKLLDGLVTEGRLSSFAAPLSQAPGNAAG